MWMSQSAAHDSPSMHAEAIGQAVEHTWNTQGTPDLLLPWLRLLLLLSLHEVKGSSFPLQHGEEVADCEVVGNLGRGPDPEAGICQAEPKQRGGEPFLATVLSISGSGK